jgi:hypothetical protein
MRRHREHTACADAVSDIADGIAKVIEGGLRIPADILDDVFDRCRDSRRRSDSDEDWEEDCCQERGDQISERLDQIDKTLRAISTALPQLKGEGKQPAE